MASIDLEQAVEESDGAIVVTLPVQKSAYFLGPCMLGVVFLAVLVGTTTNHLRGVSPIGWTEVLFLLVVGLFAVPDLIWALIGQEVLVVSASRIELRHTVMKWAIRQRFAPGEIDGLFVSREPFPFLYWHYGASILEFYRGRIAVNSGRNLLGGVRTYRIGSALTKDEAANLVGFIHQRFPQYVYRTK